MSITLRSNGSVDTADLFIWNHKDIWLVISPPGGRNAPLFLYKKSGSLRILLYHVYCSNVFGSHPQNLFNFTVYVIQ